MDHATFPRRPAAEGGLPLATLLLCGLCLAAFSWQLVQFGWTTSAAEAGTGGGLSRAALGAGEWWSVATAHLIHANVWHLAGNLAVIGLVGLLVERRIGTVDTALLIGFGATCASLATLAFAANATTVSAGASGIAAALVTGAFGVRAPRRSLLWDVRLGMLVCVLASAVATFPASIAPHAGGLVAGAMFALASAGALERRSARA